MAVIAVTVAIVMAVAVAIAVVVLLVPSKWLVHCVKPLFWFSVSPRIAIVITMVAAYFCFY